MARIRERMDNAAQRAGRPPESVRLICVSKRFPVDVARAAVEAGARDLGENYVQEARGKIAAMPDAPVRWHLIGHLQRNKARYVPGLFELVHTVDSYKLARELDKQAARAGVVQDVLLQVNVGGETQKAGIEPDRVAELAGDVSGLPGLSLKGLMCMPPFFDQPERVSPFFARLRECAEDVRRQGIAGISMDELSMGMSGDFEVAIAEGATLVRVGTSIFGERP